MTGPFAGFSGAGSAWRVLACWLLSSVLFAQSVPGVYQIDSGSGADQYFTGGSAWDDPTNGTGLYETLRYGPAFSYQIPASPGLYMVVLDFVEPNKTAPGQRLFTVAINGQRTGALDIWYMAGGANHVISITYLALVPVDQGISISFQTANGQNAIVSAIRISPVWFTGAPCRPPGTAGSAC